ncbi:MAG: hypothetical protein ABSB15_08300 [Bryobacteraceae bacterium]
MKLIPFLICFAVLPCAYAQPDSKALLSESIHNYELDWRAGMLWGYTQTDVTRADGTDEVDVSEVVPLEGTPYERLIRKDGRPLTAEERRKEDRKFEKASRERKKESPEERAARIEKYESQRSFLKDLPSAYDVSPMGDGMVDGRPAWILGVTPRADFVPTTPHGGMLKHIEGKLWIDKQDVQWAKAEAHVIDPISIGWILARIGEGAQIKLDMARVVDGLWMPERIDIDGTARVLMVHNKVLDEHVTFSGYHPHSAASTVTHAAGR